MTDRDALARNISDTHVVLDGIAGAIREPSRQHRSEETWEEFRQRCEIVPEDDRKALEFLFRQRVEIMRGEQVGDGACNIAEMLTVQGMIAQRCLTHVSTGIFPRLNVAVVSSPSAEATKASS